MSGITKGLEDCPIIAAVHRENLTKALASPAELVFLLDANIMDVEKTVEEVHKASKKVLVHLDLAGGIGKDKAGIEFLAKLGVDGIISTRANIIHLAKEQKLLTVQRFFALDSQGVNAIEDMICSSRPDMIEVMPALATKVVKRLAKSGIPVIAGGLIEEKSEMLAALNAGAVAISTGKSELWYL